METPSLLDSLSGSFFTAARTGRNQWWRYILTLVAVAVAVLVVSLVLVAILYVSYPDSPSLMSLPAPLFLAANLLPFGAVHLILWASLRGSHRRSFASLINPRGSFRWRWLLLAGGVWLLLCGLMDAILALIYPGSYSFSFDPQRFWPAMLASLLLFPIQATAEELVFRGYLQQGLGLRATRVWLPWLLPAALFALLHLPNPEVGNYGFWATFPIYLGLGLLFGWVTIRTQGLEVAFGLHLANNLYTAIVTGIPNGTLTTPTIFTMNEFHPLETVGLFFAACLIVVLFTIRLTKGSLRVPVAVATLLMLVPLLLAGCAGGTLFPGAPTQAASTLPLEPCLLSAPGLSFQQDALCGTLAVPENPDDPAGRQVDLHVAVIKAGSSNPAPDPLILLAGGPGQAATEAYLPILPALERIYFKRDLVMIDQRGTGQSSPLECPSLDEGGLEDAGVMPDPEMLTEYARACLAQTDADPRYYTTPISMQDVEAVRQALGYGQVNLLGVSYGTRAALAYMRLYPENVRTAILDAVVSPEMVIGEAIRADAQHTLDAIFARCAADPACRAAFPDLPAEFDSLMASLADQPVELSLPHPRTGEPTALTFDSQGAASAIRTISYSTEVSALLPWLIHTAAEGDLNPLARQYLMLNETSGSAINPMLFYSVICSEDIPFLPPQGEQGSFYFFDVTENWRAACAAFPENPQATDERAYPDLAIPSLLISGSADPITPPIYAEQAASHLSQSKHVVLEGMGHGNFHVGCLPEIIRQFLEAGTTAELDTSCVERSAPLPFFVSSFGPEP